MKPLSIVVGLLVLLSLGADHAPDRESSLQGTWEVVAVLPDRDVRGAHVQHRQDGDVEADRPGRDDEAAIGRRRAGRRLGVRRRRLGGPPGALRTDHGGCPVRLRGRHRQPRRRHRDPAVPLGGAPDLHAELLRPPHGGKARAVFNGKIVVRQAAQKTDAKQTTRALLLSDNASINTKPQLEIFADDVKCTHGATVASGSNACTFAPAAQSPSIKVLLGAILVSAAVSIIGPFMYPTHFTSSYSTSTSKSRVASAIPTR